MSSFQSTVRYDLGFGVVGEIRLSYPVKSQAGVIYSATPANNVVGRVFTQNTTSGLWGAGNVGAGGVTPSILSQPKEYTTSGGAGGALTPTLTMLNEQEGVFLSKGMIVLQVLTTTTPSLGDDLHFQQADGQIIAVAPGTAVASGNQLLALGAVYMFPQPNANGLILANL